MEWALDLESDRVGGWVPSCDFKIKSKEKSKSKTNLYHLSIFLSTSLFLSTSIYLSITVYIYLPTYQSVTLYLDTKLQVLGSTHQGEILVPRGTKLRVLSSPLAGLAQ